MQRPAADAGGSPAWPIHAPPGRQPWFRRLRLPAGIALLPDLSWPWGSPSTTAAPVACGPSATSSIPSQSAPISLHSGLASLGLAQLDAFVATSYGAVYDLDQGLQADLILDRFWGLMSRRVGELDLNEEAERLVCECLTSGRYWERAEGEGSGGA